MKLDSGIMLSGSPGTIDGRAQAPSHWARLLLICSLSLVFNLFVADMSHARPAKAVMNYKLHAYNQLLDWKQFECILELYHHESRWNPKAKNGSHYGIPQGRSVWLSTANPYQQVEWGVKYIAHRYGTPCAALRHFKKVGWH